MMKNDTYSNTIQKAVIYELGVKNQLLMSHALDFCLIAETKQLQQIDRELCYFLKQTRKPFDFVGHIAGGNILLVDKGNLSFALSLTKKNRITLPISPPAPLRK